MQGTTTTFSNRYKKIRKYMYHTHKKRKENLGNLFILMFCDKNENVTSLIQTVALKTKKDLAFSRSQSMKNFKKGKKKGSFSCILSAINIQHRKGINIYLKKKKNPFHVLFQKLIFNTEKG